MHRALTLKLCHPLVRNGIWILIAVIAMTVFFGPTDNWEWDPSFYYAQIRSPLIENDLDFRNETRTGNLETEYTVTGLQNSLWPIGPSILWSPWFLAAHGVLLLTRPGQADGFYFPYISLVSLGSAAYGIGGLFLIHRLCRHFSTKAYAWMTTVLCLGATPLFFYVFRQPIMAHTTGFLVSTAMMLIYMVLTQSQVLSQQSGILFGVTWGLCFLTRWTGLLMGIVPLTYLTEHLAQAIRARSRSQAKQVVQQALVMLAAFALTISPQLVLWYRLHGSFFAMPQSPGSFVDSILPINLLNVFLHTNRGLVFWCPFVLIGMAGIALIPNKRVRLIATISLICHVVLIGYRRDWYSGGGFGARYFIETLPFTAIGFVCILDKIPSQAIWRLLLVLCFLALLVHQFVLIGAVEHAPDGWISNAQYLKGKPLGVKWQLDILFRLAKNPFLWFAPRPYVQLDRQSILTNIRSGVKDLHAYLVTGTATLLAPAVIAVLLVLRRWLGKDKAPWLLVGTMLYLAAWSVYLCFVG